jgi:arabinofuranan 3-O-arabinosyltransferase
MHRSVALAGPVLLVLGVGILAYRVIQSWSDTSISQGFDFHLVYGAGRALTQGHSLFAVQLLGHPYGYPPSSALILGAPLSYFSWTTVTHILRPVQAACLVATVLLSARTVGRSWSSLAAGVGVLLVSLAGISNDALGLENASIFVALLGAAAFLAWSQERYILCGLLFGLSIALKPLLLPLCLGLILLRRWNVLGTAALVVAVLNLLTLGIDPKSLNGMGTFVRGLLTDSGVISGAFFLFNSAYVSMGVLFGWPSLLTTSLRVCSLPPSPSLG